MSVKDMVYDYRSMAERLDRFLYDGEMKKPIKTEHTKEELEEILETIRLESWASYREAATELGWI